MEIPQNTVYDQRYQSTQNYWEFKPSSMAYKLLELYPPVNRRPKVLEIGCGEGGTAVFLARNGYEVTAFDWSNVGVQKTKESADRCGVQLNVFQADINEFVPTESFDIAFSSGTLQYLLPSRRKSFIDGLQRATSKDGVHVLQTFVHKPFVEIAPDAESNEHLWTSGELLTLYKDWFTEDFVEEVKPCNSSGIPHRHVHNRIWVRKV
jgi:tellurite methyltransferase